MILLGGVLIIDSKGNEISIGDRVRVLWNFDNQFYLGDVVKIKDREIEIEISPKRRIMASKQTIITKIPFDQTF